MMKDKRLSVILMLPVLLLIFWVVPVIAEVYVQCPCYRLDPVTGKPDPTKLLPAGLYRTTGVTVLPPGTKYNAATQNVECKYTTGSGASRVTHSAACKSLSAGDGHIRMADGNDLYIFGFDEMTGVPVNQILNMVDDPVAPGGKRGAEATAPTINIAAGQEFYLSLTNVTMFERPDLSDPHTVHYHGFPNAANVFDGEPIASIAVNMGETVTYYYNNVEPGTYMYHCHVEAAEHMQMGMLGNLYVRPQQDGTSITFGGKTYTNFAYNDCPVPGNASCGSTGYNVAYPLEVTGADWKFHHNDGSYNLVDFAAMDDTYSMFNGRGYPDTVNPCTDGRQTPYPAFPANYPICTQTNQDLLNNVLGVPSQNTSALITAVRGQKILLHAPSLATSEFNTVAAIGIPFQIVGQGARQYKGPGTTPVTYYYNTSSYTYGGGEGYDVLIDTSNVQPGTYFIYTTNLNRLSNDAQDLGGLMTEVVIN